MKFSIERLFGLPLLALLFASLPCSLTVSAQQEQQELQCSFSEEIALNADNTVFLQQYVNRREGTYSVRVRYTEGYSWIGIGINYYGDAYMVPAYSVIGRMEDDGSLSVARYWLERIFVTGILPIDDPNEHLKWALLIQQDGETILEFTHDLVIMEEGIVYENVTADSTWIWAVGPDDNEWGTRHSLQGSFQLEQSETCIDPTETVSNQGNETSLPSGFGEAVEGDPNSGTIGAASSTNVVFNESQTKVSRGLWITHGLFMAFAWGILAPLAIGASFFRNLGFLDKNALWFKLHVYLNLTVAFLTFVGFFLAVGATNKEGLQTHFKDDTHHKVGLTIFLFVFAQCLLGCFRPAAEASSSPSPAEQREQPKELTDDGSLSKSDSTTIAAEPSEKPVASGSDDAQGFEIRKPVSSGSDDEKAIEFEKPLASGTDDAQAVQSEKLLASGTDDEQGFEFDVADITALTDQTEDDEAIEIDVTKDDDSWSLFTPPPPPDTPPPSDEIDDGEGQEIEPEEATDDTASATPSISSSNTETSNLRTYWKYAHRAMGVILLGLAWFNCHSGIQLFSTKYATDNEQQLLNIFWGFTATIAVVFLVQGYVLRK